MAPPGEISRLLAGMRVGDSGCESRLLSLVYDELRMLAAAQLRNERDGHTLQASALVHEAYLRLVGAANEGWANRAHFFTVAAGMMRRVLIDHARAHRAKKRDGALKRVDLDKAPGLFDTREDATRIIALDEGLTELARMDERQAKVVELRFFAGLTVEQAAEVLGISEKTVKRDWSIARAWLRNHIQGSSP